MNYITSVVQLMDICESELLFDTLPITKAQHQYIKRVWMKNSVVEKPVGSKYGRYEYRVNGKRHRTDGNPAVVYASGKFWCINNGLRRINGPAITYNCGVKYWYVNNKSHRVGGPASVYTDGNKYWYVNGKRHRVDGPASVHADGDKYWYVNGQLVNEF